MRSLRIYLILVIIGLLLVPMGCAEKSDVIDAQDVTSIKLVFLPERGTDRTYVQNEDANEIELFINAYNKAEPYQNDHETTHPVTAYVYLENGKEIIVRGGTQGFQTVTQENSQYNISGSDLNQYFKNLLNN